ncbi:MAG TPA: DUF885 domain-containing protein [Thermoanaerobaculia bacterium]|nr:DUF885 domain-containing protein [Thermoanaerobaculia bacterium]
MSRTPIRQDPLARARGRQSDCRLTVVPCCIVVALLGLSSIGCDRAPQTDSPRSERSAALWSLFERDWEFRLDEDPLFATSVGDFRNLDELSSVAFSGLERRAEFDRETLARLESIDRDALSEEDRINAQLFERQLRDRIAAFELGDWQMPVNADSGFHMGFARLGRQVPLRSAEHYESYIARLREWPRYVGEQIDNMRVGVEGGMTPPKVTLQGYEATVELLIVDEPERSPFWEPFESFPAAVPEAERERLRQEGRAAIREAIVPGYRSFLEFLSTEYIPGARGTLAAHDLPGGEEYYRHQIRTFTTLDLSPEEIHRIGLDEVARIRAEMQAILEEVGFEGTFAEFLDFLRTDPRFYVETPRALLEKASYIAKKMDGELPSLFGTLPRMPYTVEAVPEHIAPKYTAGRYVNPSLGSTEPGIYWVNTYALDSRPLYTLTALTLHEAVPGHHLQGALAEEQGNQPDFRRFDYISAFGEGWGLYSEWLGIEAGMYETPYDHFGRLTYEIWRACRLVVDTGVHAMGWTRQQVLDYMAEHTALPLHEITTETDRYISWPGQALAYKLGEIEIRRLRRQAEEELGTDFDVREFHDAVLRNGSVPLPVLAESVERYIAEAKS